MYWDYGVLMLHCPESIVYIHWKHRCRDMIKVFELFKDTLGLCVGSHFAGNPLQCLYMGCVFVEVLLGTGQVHQIEVALEGIR